MIYQIFSTLPSFKKIYNLKSGLNVLLAEKVHNATNKQTRNRAGKTSFVELIHFLMGANLDAESIFRTNELINYIFGMDFDLNTSKISVERSGENPSIMNISTAVSSKEWISILGESLFGLNSLQKKGSKPPSFRSLFSYFVRRQLTGAFVTPEKQATMQQVGDVQISLMFLLGLDWQIARDWQVVRDKERMLKQLKKAIGKNIFGNIIGKMADLRTQLTVEEARLKRLQMEIKTFRTLDRYHEMEVEADNLTRKLNQLANENTIDLASIHDLENALSSEVSPEMEDLQTVYQEATVVLPGVVTQRYEDVIKFHQSIIRNRKDYLTGELEAAKFRIQSRDLEKARLDNRRIELMSILETHGALDQFNQLQGEIARLQAHVKSIRQRFEATEKLESSKSELEIERNQLRLRLRRDFAERKSLLEDAILAFEETSQRLYESAGSMTIEETANGPVFKFPMQGSRSKGIKNMQIFCFDMMLMRLCAKRGIGPGFLIHDSHLFDGVDGRQIVRALRIGAETAEEVGFQYIVTMNEDDAFKEKENGFNLDNYILPIRLTDASEDGGLFGIRFS